MPVDAPGLTIIARPAGRPGEAAARFSNRYGQSTGVVVFDDVFVPHDRVFLAGEVEEGGYLTTSYATHHRHSCIGARAGFGDLLIGAGALMTQANGLDPDRHGHTRDRTDDVVNVTGHRLSIGALEEAMSTHAAVAECAVIGVHDAIKGEVPLGFVVLRTGVLKTGVLKTGATGDIARQVVAVVRERIGPVAAMKRVVVERLPKTRSGKILRDTMKKIADGAAWTMPATIEDAGVLAEITQALAE